MSRLTRCSATAATVSKGTQPPGWMRTHPVASLPVLVTAFGPSRSGSSRRAVAAFALARCVPWAHADQARIARRHPRRGRGSRLDLGRSDGRCKPTDAGECRGAGAAANHPAKPGGAPRRSDSHSHARRRDELARRRGSHVWRLSRRSGSGARLPTLREGQVCPRRQLGAARGSPIRQEADDSLLGGGGAGTGRRRTSTLVRITRSCGSSAPCRISTCSRY